MIIRYIAIAAASAAATATMTLTAAPSTAEGDLPTACEYEDSTDCIWDGRHRGDGRGSSAYHGKREGVYYRIPHRLAHNILD